MQLHRWGPCDGTLLYTRQGTAEWFAQANTALGNLSAVISPAASSQPESEDCLFLDVIAPIKLFQQRASKKKLAPVLFNIHGGGFFIGEKRALYPPNGLLEASNNDFIYVSINYRLGAFGFLSHLQPSSDNKTAPNAGLLDQRFALKWVQKYIHLFGGDARQVTITGESAGGGSVQYQTAAYGGAKETNLFIRGIAQSPAPCLSDPIYPAIGANLFLQNAGVSNLTAARKLSTQVLQQANLNAQNATPFNVFYFGPTIDADFVPDILPRSYNGGKYVKELKLIATDNQNEARFLGNQSIKSNADFNNWVHVNFPSAPSSIQNEIINHIYPPVYDASSPYATPQERSDLAVKEYLISCQTVSIAKAYKNQTYNYIFGVAPAIHAQDLAYTYYPNGATPHFYPTVAVTLQNYLTNFVLTGNPNKKGLSPWPIFGQHAAAINFTETGVSQTTSDSANSRCAFWNQGSYYPRGPCVPRIALVELLGRVGWVVIAAKVKGLAFVSCRASMILQGTNMTELIQSQRLPARAFDDRDVFYDWPNNIASKDRIEAQAVVTGGISGVKPRPCIRGPSSTTNAMSATPEQIAYQQAHASEFNAVGLSAFSIVGVILVGLATILRVYSRRISRIPLQADDYTLIIASILSIIAVMLNATTVMDWGMGRHFYAQSKESQMMYYKIDWVFNFFYTTGYPLSRISLCLLYRRIFVQQWFRIICWFFVGAFTCYMISTIIVDSVLTLPVNAFWDSNVKPTRTLDLVKLYTANAAFNITTDTILLFLPLTIVWRLSMTWLQKLGLTAIFCFGALTLVASIARMTVFGAVRGDDITYTITPVAWWTNAELLLGILCPCLVTFRPLFRSASNVLSFRFSSRRRGYYKSGDSGVERFGSNGKIVSNQDKSTKMTGNSIGGGHLTKGGAAEAVNPAGDTARRDEEMATVFVGVQHDTRGGSDIALKSLGHTNPTYRNGIEYTE
ncbi:MAG: hypothetical protein Q9181_004203 [Wetmoreana brouardii]